jgi:hypothetical protein
MKKRLLSLVFLILLAAGVSAMTVTLGGPTGTQTTSTINFGCMATADTGETLSRLTLWHNIGGTFQANETTTSATSGTEYAFSIPNVPNGNYEWNCEASNTTNTFVAASNNTFTVNVPVNNAPIYSTIPDQIWPENAQNAINLGSYFSDPDGDTLTYSSTTPANIAVSISGATATLTPNAWHGTTTIQFTANDGKGGTNTTTVNLNVTHVNNNPYNKTEYINNLSWTIGDVAEIDLDDYFGDSDGDTLTTSFRYPSGTTHHINITIDNSTAEATLTPEPDWKGAEKVIFTAYDGHGGSLDSNEVLLTVREGTAVNHKPTINSSSPAINPILITTDPQRNAQEFTINAQDPDLDNLEIRWYLDSAELSESRNKMSYTFLALSAGTYDLKVIASDGEFSDTKNWTITVEGGNQGPQQPQIPTTPTPNACGNGQVNQGETCSTCPQDVICQPGYKCQNNKCTREVKKSNLTLILIVGGAFIIFAAATLLIYNYYKKRTLFGGWKPKHTGDTEGIQLMVKPKQETTTTANAQKTETTPKWDNKKKTVNEVLMKHFIQTNLKRGEPIEKIKEKLKKVGWSDEKIDEACKAEQLDETYK